MLRRRSLVGFLSACQKRLDLVDGWSVCVHMRAWETTTWTSALLDSCQTSRRQGWQGRETFGRHLCRFMSKKDGERLSYLRVVFVLIVVATVLSTQKLQRPAGEHRDGFSSDLPNRAKPRLPLNGCVALLDLCLDSRFTLRVIGENTPRHNE